MMNVTSLKIFILKVIVILIAFINVIVFESEAGSTLSYLYHPKLTNVELVVHSNFSHNLKYVQNDSQLIQKNVGTDTFYFKSFGVDYLSPIYATCYFIPKFLNHQQEYSPNQYILSILHKTNIWHQSSDDEPLPSVA